MKMIYAQFECLREKLKDRNNFPDTEVGVLPTDLN